MDRGLDFNRQSHQYLAAVTAGPDAHCHGRCEDNSADNFRNPFHPRRRSSGANRRITDVGGDPNCRRSRGRAWRRSATPAAGCWGTSRSRSAAQPGPAEATAIRRRLFAEAGNWCPLRSQRRRPTGRRRAGDGQRAGRKNRDGAARFDETATGPERRRASQSPGRPGESAVDARRWYFHFPGNNVGYLPPRSNGPASSYGRRSGLPDSRDTP